MQYKKGQLHNGFDYDLQVWVKNGIIQDCGHPEPKRDNGGYFCCKASEYAGRQIKMVRSELSI